VPPTSMAWPTHGDVVLTDNDGCETGASGAADALAANRNPKASTPAAASALSTRRMIITITFT
jgi:hypothetical protein